MSRDHYEVISRSNGELHPVDEAIVRVLPQRALHRRVRTATEALLQALGQKRDLWLHLEELQVQFRVEREAAYFNLGYEHGAATARMQHHATRSRGEARAQRELSARIRSLALEASLPVHARAATLLDAVRALVLSMDQGPSGEIGV